MGVNGHQIGKKIRVLIIDDSAIVRKILSESLAGESDIEVVGTAPDPYVARDKIVALHPDVLTLDIEMPRMDGLTFLKKLMRAHPLPVIVISSLTQRSSASAIEALSEGAVEVLAKPSGPYSVGEFKNSLAQKLRAASYARLGVRRETVAPKAVPAPLTPVSPLIQPAVLNLVTRPVPPSSTLARQNFTCPLIAIGASTGGTEAIERILLSLPAMMPPIVIVQHIPAGFSRAFAERLDRQCRIHVREGVHGDLLTPGTVILAPGDYHMRTIRMAGRLRVALDQGPQVCYQRPAVDVLFQSIQELGLPHVVAALLTGMGSDGANGMVALRSAGAWTIAQDEATCVVFGMPREAIRLGGASQVLPLNAIAPRLVALASSPEAGPPSRTLGLRTERASTY